MNRKPVAQPSPKRQELLEALLRQRGLDSSPSQKIPRRCVNGLIPLSFAQQRLWLLDQLTPGSPAYNIPVVLRLAGPLDVAALEHGISEIVRNHEILRTTFAVKNDQPVQTVATELHVAMPVVDLRDLSYIEREQRAMTLAQAEIKKPFDLQRGPLLRVTLLRLAEEDHVLLVIVHHVIFEGWSIAVFLRELSSRYESYVKNEDSKLPELPIQYGDFACWEREWLQGEVLETQLAYWKEQLAGSNTRLDLPADHPRSTVRNLRGAWQSQVLPSDLAKAIRELSEKEGVTLFMVMLAAFKTLLHRYTGQEDILVGSVISNRRRVELEELIGCFINTLVLRTDLSGDPSFRQLLERVRHTSLSAFAHQDIPFEYLVDALGLERSMSHNPLFEVAIVLQSAPTESSWRVALKLPGVTATPIWVHSGAAKFDLTLEIEEMEQGLSISFEYNTDLFDTTTIERMLGHFRTLLEGIVAGPEQRLSNLPLLTEPERCQLLVEWNDTKADYPTDQCVHQLFEAQVERTPDAVAVVVEDQQLTYRELNARANQLANYLRNLRVGPEVLAGICMERSVEMVVGLLGILKAGGAYVPLDPGYPKERLAFILEDTQAPVLLTQRHLLPSLPEQWAKAGPEQSRRIVCLDSDWEVIAQESLDSPISSVTGDNLAYVMYTSGSTGTPKGVAVPHRGVLRLLLGANYVQLDAKETFLQMAPISFDASTFELWGALLHGARCVLYPAQVATASDLGNAIQKHGVSTLWLTASLFNAVIDEAPEALSGVGQLLIGGEALSVAHVRSGLEHLPSTQIINGYGPTESTTFTCCYLIPRELGEATKSVPIGKPISNTRVYLLDPHLNPVPIGVAGELCIGGDGLARGYLNRPELTAEKFIPNPFDQELGARLYKTGDLARYLPDGNIEFLGRIDDQVKIRGFRVEPGELEAVLGRHPAVQESAVLVREDTPGDKRLVAYVVPNQQPPPTISELRRFLKEKLPEYMVASSFVMLDTLPLTPNGKVDRRALPAPDGVRPGVEEAFVPPGTALESMIAEVWQQALHVEKVGLHDSFFDLGGHSLLLVLVHSKLAEVFNGAISIVDLFKYPTVSLIAEHLSREDSQTPSNQKSHARARARKASVQQQEQLRRGRRVAQRQ